MSVTAWTSMITGKNPEDHGVFECTYRKKNTYEFGNLSSSFNIKEKTIWDIASENNKKSVVCFVPLTWPPKPLNGCLISGFMTPLSEETDYSYPKKLKKEINDHLGEPLPIDVKDYKKLDIKDQLSEVHRMTRLHMETMKYLIKNKEWDLFFGVVMGSDRLNHKFWKYCDKTHRDYNPGSQFENALKDYYILVDKYLGEMLGLIGEEVVVIVLSDHGIMKMDNRVNLSDWLIKEGYLVLKESVSEISKLDSSMVDWTKTKASAIGAYDGKIFFNVKGRDPEGIIEQFEYDSFFRELEEKLKQIQGDDGKKLDTQVFRKRQISGMKYDEVTPDMIVYFDNMNYGSNVSRIGNPSLWSPQTALGSDDATHSLKGMFVMKGGSQKGEIEEVDIVDVPTTILYYMGIKLPEDLKGKVIK